MLNMRNFWSNMGAKETLDGMFCIGILYPHGHQSYTSLEAKRTQAVASSLGKIRKVENLWKLEKAKKSVGPTCFTWKFGDNGDGDFDDDDENDNDGDTDDEARALKHNQKLYTSS